MIRKDTAKTFMFVCFRLAALAGVIPVRCPQCSGAERDHMKSCMYSSMNELTLNRGSL